MTTVYVSYTITNPDDEDREIELAVEVSADGDIIELEMRDPNDETRWIPVSAWTLRQIDMGDLAEDVLRRLKGREREWP